MSLYMDECRIVGLFEGESGVIGCGEWVGKVVDLAVDGNMKSIKRLGVVDGWVGEESRCDGCDLLVVRKRGMGIAVDCGRYMVASNRGVQTVRQKDVANWAWFGNEKGWMLVPEVQVAWRVLVWYLGAMSGCGPVGYGRLRPKGIA